MFKKSQSLALAKNNYSSRLFFTIGIIAFSIISLSCSQVFAESLLAVKAEMLENVKSPAIGPNVNWLSNPELKFYESKGMANLGGKWVAGVSYEPIEAQGDQIIIKVDFIPYESFNGWMDGHLISLIGMDENVVCQLEMVRRGRFRIKHGDNAAVSPVIKWDGGKSTTLQIIWAKEDVRLEIDGKTWLSVKGPGFKADQYMLRVGKLKNGDPGATGWYSSWSVETTERTVPAEQIDLSKQNPRLVQLLELDKKIVLDNDPVSAVVTDFRLSRARRAAARIALDSLWAKVYSNSQLTFFDNYFNELAAMANQINQADVSDEMFPLSATVEKGKWLKEEDQQLYFGQTGWAMGGYMRELAQLGFNIVSTALWPDRVFSKEGKWNEEFIEARLMPLLDEAARYGIQVDIGCAPYTPEYLIHEYPQWDGVAVGYGMPTDLIEKHSEWKGRIAGHGFLKASIINSDYRQMCDIYLTNIVGRLRSHPALVSYCLANEPQFEDYSAPMQDRFQKFLQDKYSAISDLNQKWNTNYSNWDEILIDRTKGFDRSNPVRFMDWIRFNWETGSEYFSFLNELVKKNDPVVVTHVKHLPYEFGMPWMKPNSKERDFYDYADGVNRMDVARITSISGTDSWADSFKGKNPTLYQSMYFELLRTYAGTVKPIFDSEWHIINCYEPTPPQYVAMTMQLNVVSGLRAGTLWVGHPLVYSADIFSSAALLLETGATAARMRHLNQEYFALANRPRAIAILYSPKAKYLQGDPYINSMERLFEVGLYTGLGIRLIDERQVIAGETQGIKAIISINCNKTMEETPAALKLFAEKGGHVVLIGEFATNAETSDFAGQKNVKQEELTAEFNKLYNYFMDLGRAIDEIPAAKVVSDKNEPVDGVRWHACKQNDGNVLVFAANISQSPICIKIEGEGTLYNVVKAKAEDRVFELPVCGVFLGQLKK